MSTTLNTAHDQWSSRPADETYPSLEEMHAACLRHRQEAIVTTVDVSILRVEALSDTIQLVGRANKPALLTNWAFGQLCQRAGAPASYLRELPPTLAAQNLNHGLARYSRDARGKEREASLLLANNGLRLLRACLTESYTRIWNADITERLLALQASQPAWKLPLAYDRHDGQRGTPDPASGMVPRGAYASDRDMFVFLVDEVHAIDAGGGRLLRRGFFIWNSEVGSKSLGITTFLYDFVCGNHYVWGAENVSEIRVRHIGDADKRGWGKVIAEVQKYADRRASDDEARIQTARTYLLGGTKEEVLDRIFGKRIPELGLKLLGAAYDRAETNSAAYGDPRSAWAMASGITELSQDEPNTDTRTALDRAAGKVIEIAF